MIDLTLDDPTARLLDMVRWLGKEYMRPLGLEADRMDHQPAIPAFNLATVFTDVRPEMRLAREEIFGPILSMFRFRDADEVVRLANDTHSAEPGALQVRDVAEARRPDDRPVGCGSGHE